MDILELIVDFVPFFEMWERSDPQSFNLVQLIGACFWGLMGVVLLVGGVRNSLVAIKHSKTVAIHIGSLAFGVLLLGAAAFLALGAGFGPFGAEGERLAAQMPDLLAIGSAIFIGGMFGWMGLTGAGPTEASANISNRVVALVVSALLFAYALLIGWLSFGGGWQQLCDQGPERRFVQTQLCPN